MDRIAKLNRKTNETDIKMELNLDGSGKYEIDTGIGFLDHMLTGFAKHGFFDLTFFQTFFSIYSNICCTDARHGNFVLH